MEGSEYFGEQTLVRTDMNKDEVFNLLDYSYSKVPYANGMNNHTGSVASKNRDIVSYMIEYAVSNNKYFIDSYTVAGSLIYDMAIEYGVKTAKRSVFLDNERDYDSIMKQWRELIRLSKEHGGAIGIGHYQSIETLNMLENSLPILAEEGIVSININEIFTVQNIIIYFIVINLIGFFVMWLDKRKAIKGSWRIPEKTLFLITALGGGIGTIAGMYTFRHKTKKLGFAIGFPFITILEVILIIWLIIK